MGFTPKTKKLIMRRGIFALLIIAVAVAQNTQGFLPEIFGARVFCTLPLLVCIAMCEREDAGIFFGLLAGAVLDATGGVQGINAIMLTVFGFFCGLLITKLIRNNIFTALLFSAVCTLIYIGVYWLIAVLPAGGDGAGMVLLRFYLPSALYTLVTVPAAFWIVRAVSRRFGE